MKHAHVRSGIAALVAVAAVTGCDLGEEEPDRGPPPDARPALLRAAERTLDAGPSAMSATVRSGSERYRLAGRVDARRGYRFCGLVRRAGGEFPHGRTIWLEGRAGTHGTLTAASRGCAAAATWLDDHPPTLDLDRQRPIDRSPGGEDFLHATLEALTRLDRVAGPSSRFHGCGSSECVRAAVDFGALDRRPATRDEDGWTLRPLLRRLGRHPVTFGLDPEGRVDRVVLAVRGARRRVTTTIELGDFGERAPVPRVGMGPIAIE